MQERIKNRNREIENYKSTTEVQSRIIQKQQLEIEELKTMLRIFYDAVDLPSNQSLTTSVDRCIKELENKIEKRPQRGKTNRITFYYLRYRENNQLSIYMI